MKSVSSLLLTILVAASAQANVTPPKAFISEVFFSSSGDWTIELGFYPYYYSEFDSILIESSSGSSPHPYFFDGPAGFDRYAGGDRLPLEQAQLYAGRKFYR